MFFDDFEKKSTNMLGFLIFLSTSLSLIAGWPQLYVGTGGWLSNEYLDFLS